MKINWENYIFHVGKWNFEPTGDSAHTTESLALEKTLLVTFFLYLIIYI